MTFHWLVIRTARGGGSLGGGGGGGGGNMKQIWQTVEQVIL